MQGCCRWARVWRAVCVRHRWSGGEAIAPAGDVRRHTLSEARRAKATEAWGAALSGVQDVQRVFEKYYGGEAATLPW